MKTQIKPKQFYLERIIAHEKAHEVIRGIGWNGTKGCSIGCTLENYDHAAYEEAGIGPEWFARVQDILFEGMTKKKSETWTSVITKAIPDHLHGDVKNPEWDKIKAKFLIVVLKLALESFDHKKYPDVKKAVEGSITLWKRKDIGSKEFNAAANAAAYAATAAAYAANAAAYAAATAAANAAAYAAVYAAVYSYAKFDYFADELIKILKAVKPRRKK